MRALIIGGTRNLGPAMVQALLERGDDVTIFNRGLTSDELPPSVTRLRGDRTDPAVLRAVMAGHHFDVVIDTTLYTGAEAQATVEVFSERVERYIFISSGQVYLLRPGLQRPFREQDYAGPVMTEPSRENKNDHSNWLYGHGKRQAEDIFAKAWKDRRFPYTSLRLPMVNSERDHYHRIYGYILRLRDGGAIVVPEGSGLPLRHVYGEDVVQAVTRIIQSDGLKGDACNIGQDESVSLEDFLRMLGAFIQKPVTIARVPREKLERAGLMPDCSPFSGRWMSALDNTRSKAELKIEYTPLAVYLEKLVRFFLAHPLTAVPEYARRREELELAAEVSGDDLVM